LALTAGNRHQQVTSVVKRNYWYFKLCVCIYKLHKLN